MQRFSVTNIECQGAQTWAQRPLPAWDDSKNRFQPASAFFQLFDSTAKQRHCSCKTSVLILDLAASFQLQRFGRQNGTPRNLCKTLFCVDARKPRA